MQGITFFFALLIACFATTARGEVTGLGSHLAAKSATLQEALRSEKERLGALHMGYGRHADPTTCATFKTVKLACDYNTRGTLSLFLTVNGKGLFPAAGGTNPYYTKPDAGLLDDGFIGRPVQNKRLREAVRRNAKLFKNGDLTAEAVRKQWR